MAMLADSDEQVRNVVVNKALMTVGEIQEDLVLRMILLRVMRMIYPVMRMKVEI